MVHCSIRTDQGADCQSRDNVVQARRNSVGVSGTISALIDGALFLMKVSSPFASDNPLDWLPRGEFALHSLISIYLSSFHEK